VRRASSSSASCSPSTGWAAVTVPIPLDPRDDNGSAGHGSSGSTNLSWSRGSRVSTRDPLTDGFVFFSDIFQTYGTA